MSGGCGPSSLSQLHPVPLGFESGSVRPDSSSPPNRGSRALSPHGLYAKAFLVRMRLPLGAARALRDRLGCSRGIAGSRSVSPDELEPISRTERVGRGHEVPAAHQDCRRPGRLEHTGASGELVADPPRKQDFPDWGQERPADDAGHRCQLGRGPLETARSGSLPGTCPQRQQRRFVHTLR